MILLGDIVGESDDAVAKAASEVIRIANARGGEGFVAVSAEARKKFWLDRSRTAAIAKHTNAFKINEDVVIPLDRLGDYTDGVERLNIEMSIRNKVKLADRLAQFFADPDAEHLWRTGSEARPTDSELTAALDDARALVVSVRARWQDLLRPPRHDVSRPAEPRRCRVVEARAQGAAGNDLRRPQLRAAARSLQRAPPRSAAQSRVHRAAHARRRRQRAHEPAGELGRLRDAAGGQRGCRPRDGACSRTRWRHFRRARHRHHQARIPHRRRARAVRRLQASRRSAGTLQSRQADARARAAGRPHECVHTVVLADRPREPDSRAERDRRDNQCDQGLPALRQVQGALRDAFAARKPAVQPAQQDTRDVASDRGIPLRRADATWRVAAPLRRVRRRRRPLHRVPQVLEPVSGRHRLRRRVDRDAQPAAQARAGRSSIRARPRRCSS